jgi:hypothetical protein
LITLPPCKSAGSLAEHVPAIARTLLGRTDDDFPLLRGFQFRIHLPITYREQSFAEL